VGIGFPFVELVLPYILLFHDVFFFHPSPFSILDVDQRIYEYETKSLRVASDGDLIPLGAVNTSFD
jgi:hypothetical protein